MSNTKDISLFDSICINKAFQGEEWRYKNLHYCITEESFRVYTDSIEISSLGKDIEEYELIKSSIFDLLKIGLKKFEKIRYRKPLEIDSMTGYEIELYSEGYLILDTLLLYGPDYAYLSDDMLLFIENMNSLSSHYNSLIKDSFGRNY